MLLASCSQERSLFVEQANLQQLAGQLGGIGLLNGPAGKNRVAPTSLAIAGSGAVWFASRSPWAPNANVIQSLDLRSGEVTTAIGNPACTALAFGTGSSACLGGVSSMVSDGGSKLFLNTADTQKRVIARVDVTSGVVEDLSVPVASGDDFKTALGYASGKLYYIVNSALVAFDVTSRSSQVRASLPALSELDLIGDIVVDANQTIYFSLFNRRALYSLRADQSQPELLFASDQAGSQDGDFASARVRSIGGIELGAGGEIFITDPNSANIRKIDRRAGMVTTLAGDPQGSTLGNRDGVGTQSLFTTPIYVRVVEEQLLVADRGAGTLRLIDQASRVKTIAGTAATAGYQDGSASGAQFSAPRTVLVMQDDVVIIDQAGQALRRLQTNRRQVSTVLQSTSLGMKSGTGQFDGTLAGAALADPLQPTLLLLAQSDRILRVDLSSLLIETFLTLGSDGPNSANALASDERNYWFIVDSYQGVIYRVPWAGGAPERWLGQVGERQIVNGNASEVRFGAPRAIVFDHNHFLYLVDGQVIRKIDLASGVTTTLAGDADRQTVVDGVGTDAGFAAPGALSISPDGQTLFVVDLDGALVRQVSAARGEVTTLAGALYQAGIVTGLLPARLNDIQSLAVLPDGNLVLSSRIENSLLRLHRTDESVVLR